MKIERGFKMLKCRFKNQFDFTIDTNTKTIKWGNVEGELKQFIDGITGEISSIAGVKGYSEYLKAYSYITPNIYKKDITECNDWDKLNQMFDTKKGEVEKMERKTWKEYLEGCDVSMWKWSNVSSLDIVDETEDEYIVRLSLSDIIDDPFMEIEEIEETGETMINWGGNDWVIITDFDENHDVFVKIYKAPDLAIWGYTCDGNLYVDEYEK